MIRTINQSSPCSGGEKVEGLLWSSFFFYCGCKNVVPRTLEINEEGIMIAVRAMKKGNNIFRGFSFFISNIPNKKMN